jgi:hypothetical protein
LKIEVSGIFNLITLKNIRAHEGFAMKTGNRLACVIINILLGITLLSCSGGGGGGGTGGSGGSGGNPPATIITGKVVDGFVAGATVTAYQVNANGTQGPQIGTPVQTDQFGNYSLNLGSYTGPVLMISTGGTYIDTVTGNTIDLLNSTLILSAIVPYASGNVTVQITPLTTMATNVALTLTGQGTPVATAADNANALIQNYFGLTAPILNTALINLTTTGCMTGAGQASADTSAILAGISQLAYNNGVSALDLVQALIQDVTSDGQFDGLASGTPISVLLTSGTGTIPLSTIEGTALTGLANAITSFMTTPASNICGATVDPGVISALSNTSIFTVPAVPTGVTSTADYGAAIISWNTVTGATSYNIYLATSTGVTATSTQLPGYRSIPNVTSPYAVSAGLTSATYYFVVTAVSGTSPFIGYEGAASAEVSSTVIANAFPPQWAQTVTAGNNKSSFKSVSVASDGSVYAAGYIDGTGAYNFGNSVTAAGAYPNGLNAALVKYDSTGAAQWAQTVTGGIDNSYFYGVSVASDGSIYAAGYIYASGTFDFGNGVTAARMYIGYNPVLVKYDSTGLAQWVRTVTAGSGGSFFNNVAVASDGSVYAAGYIDGTGTYDFGNNVTATGTYSGDNIVLVKYSNLGVAQWAQTVTTGSLDSFFNSVSVASDGSVYAAGYIDGSYTYDFGNSVSTAGTYTTGINMVLVKYDSTGAAQWAQTGTAGSNYSIFNSVSVAPDGSVYAAGQIYGTGTFDFGNGVTAAGTYTGFNTVLVKYDSSGVALWAQSVTAGGDYSIFNSVSVASDGSVYAAGSIDGTGTYNFGNNATTTGMYHGENLILVKYDSSGTAQWAQTMLTGNGSSAFNGVCVASDGSAYAAGQIYGAGAYNLGNGMTAAGTYSTGENVVLVKYH